MKLSCLTALVLLVALPALAQDDAPATKRMVGIWAIVLEGEREISTDEEFFEINEREYAYYRTIGLHARLEVLPYKITGLGQIDLENPLDGSIRKGIYQFVGEDRLRLCVGPWNAPRPTDCKSSAIATVHELRRVAPDTDTFRAK
jgi:hypothetical protein